MNNHLIIAVGLGVTLAVALIAVGLMWGSGVLLTIRARRRKRYSFITQEMKRIDTKGKQQ